MMRPMNHTLVAGLALLGLVVAGTTSTAQSAAPQRPPQQDGFHIVLVLAQAKSDSAAAAPELPPGVAKALKDASEFLPFKYFRVQDQAVLRGTTSEQTIRLQGPRGLAYLLELASGPMSTGDSRLFVRVHLIETTFGAPASGQQEVLSTGFPVRLGETVVVGTSKVAGDQAIVLLLTPLAPRGPEPPAAPPDQSR
jgi:hypothetical protein